MNEPEILKAIVKFYDWISREKDYHFKLWETTQDLSMKMYYGEKTSTYTTIKLYMEKYMGSFICFEKK